MSGIIKYYNHVFVELADDRVKDWAFMSTPFIPACIVIAYLYVIKSFLPTFMLYKNPYDLKRVIQCYNVFQIVANSYAFYMTLTSGWLTTLHLGCILPDYSDDPEALRLAGAIHFFLILKVVELVETTFFLLRGKENQASFLHVYHHAVTLTMIWIATKYFAGGMTSFPVLMNAFVHVLMYVYYFVSSVASPDLRKSIEKYKSWLTIVQMIQFTIAIIHGLQALLPSCPAPNLMVYIYIPNVIIVYYLFLEFFKKSYQKESKKSN